MDSLQYLKDARDCSLASALQSSQDNLAKKSKETKGRNSKSVTQSKKVKK